MTGDDLDIPDFLRRCFQTPDEQRAYARRLARLTAKLSDPRPRLKNPPRRASKAARGLGVPVVGARIKST